MGKRAYGTGSLYEKDGDWYGRWRDATGRHARKLGRAKTGGSRDGMSQKQAEAALRKVLLEADSITHAAERLTVRELGTIHLATLENHGRKPSHIRASRYQLENHVYPLLGDENVSTVDSTDVRRIIDRMLTQGKSPKTVRNVAGTLHSLLRLAVERDLLPRNPVESVRLPRVLPSTEIRFLTRDEIERVLQAAPDTTAPKAERDQWPAVRLLILTAALTGMRMGELRGLRWQDLDYGAMKIRVRHAYLRGKLSPPKSRRSTRAIPLASRLLTELEQHHRTTVWNQDADYVLANPNTGRPMDDTRLMGYFKAALKRADVRPVRIHDLRHTFGTTIAASGQVALRTLQEWMGHESITTTEIYADYMPGANEAALLDKALGGQPGGQYRPPGTLTSTGIRREQGDPT